MTEPTRAPLDEGAGPPSRRSDSVFEPAPIGLARVAADGRGIEANAQLRAMLGYRPDEPLPASLLDIVHPADERATLDCIAGLVAGTAARCALDQRWRTRDGAWLWVSVALSVVAASGRRTAEPAYLLVAVEDIAGRKEIEQRFAVQYAVSRALAQSDTVDAAVVRVLEALAEYLGWPFASYWATDEAAGVLRAVAVWRRPGAGLDEFERATREARFPPGTGLPGRVWAGGGAEWVADVIGDDGFPRRGSAAGAGLRGAFAFPVRADAAMLGVIEVLAERVMPPNDSLLQTVEAVGLQVGQFIARRQVVEAERSAQARNAAILETALDCIVTIDHEGRFLEFNPAAERTFGYRREEVLGRPMVDLIIPPPLREAHARGMARYLATGEARVLDQRLELPAVRADGTEFPVELTITRVPIPGPPTFTAYLRDLTERKRLEARTRLLLEASEVLGSSLDYEVTLGALTDLVLGHLADWYAVDLLGPDRSIRRHVVAHRDPDKVALARMLHDRYPPEPDAPIGVPHVIRTGRSEMVSEIPDELLVGVARDAEHLALLRRLGLRSFMVVPMATHDGVVGAITFVSAESGRRYDAGDLSLAEDLARRASQAIENARLFREVEETRERLEQQAVELETQAEELQAANEELASQRERAERANRAKADFLASMSHELRTPLNAIVGYTHLLADGVRGPVSEVQLGDLQRIERSAHLLIGLISDILNFAKVEAGRVRYTLAEVPVDTVVSSLRDLVAPQVEQKSLRYVYEPGDQSVTVRADRDRLVQILLNLLSNAVKFTEPGGLIRVSWAATHHDVAILVTDTGVGIPADKLEAIFEPFVQVERERGERPPGTGLGLAISRELARGMGGDLTAQSTVGRGSTFTLTLRRA